MKLFSKLFSVTNDRGIIVSVNPEYFELVEPYNDGVVIHFASGKQMNVRENYTDFQVRLSEFYGPDVITLSHDVMVTP